MEDWGFQPGYMKGDQIHLNRFEIHPKHHKTVQAEESRGKALLLGGSFPLNCLVKGAGSH